MLKHHLEGRERLNSFRSRRPTSVREIMVEKESEFWRVPVVWTEPLPADQRVADQGEQDRHADEDGAHGENAPCHLVKGLGEANVLDQPPQEPEDEAGHDKVHNDGEQGTEGAHDGPYGGLPGW